MARADKKKKQKVGSWDSFGPASSMGLKISGVNHKMNEIELRKKLVQSADPDRLAQLKKCNTCDFFLSCWFLPGDKNCRSLLKNYGGVQ